MNEKIPSIDIEEISNNANVNDSKLDNVENIDKITIPDDIVSSHQFKNNFKPENVKYVTEEEEKKLKEETKKIYKKIFDCLEEAEKNEGNKDSYTDEDVSEQFFDEVSKNNHVA